MPSYVIAGASRGIGLELVRQLAASKENVVFALVRNKELALKVPSTVLSQGPPNVHLLQADMTEAKGLKRAAEEVSKITGGTLDTLIYNAAVISGENDWRRIIDFEGEDALLDEEFRKTFDVNATGFIRATLAFLSLLQKGTTKKVIAISSRGGDLKFVKTSDLTGMSAYGASKAALNMIVCKLSLELRDEGFIFLALCPGLVDTTATYYNPLSEANVAWRLKKEAEAKKIIPAYQGPSGVEVSVKRQLEVIQGCGKQDNGSILEHLAV